MKTELATVESSELRSELPQGWIWRLTRDVARIVGGGTPKTSDPTNFAEKNQGYPWITPADLSNHRVKFISSGRRFLSKKGLKSCSATLLPKGTVLFSSRAPIGYVAIAGTELATNQGFRSFVCGDSVLPDFLYYYLRHARQVAESLASGTTFAEISGTNAGRIPIPVPHLNEQKRIVAKIEKLLVDVDALRERLAHVKAIMKRFRQAVLAAAVSGRLTRDWREEHVDLDPASSLRESIIAAHRSVATPRRDNSAPPTDDVHTLTEEDFPATWCLAELKWLCEPGRPITYGILKPGPNIADGVRYVRVADFPDNRLDVSGVRRTSGVIAQVYRRSTLRTGDVLLSIRGTVGRLCRVPVELDGANITQDTARITVSSLLNAEYILLYLQSPDVQRRLEAAKKGVAVRGINIGDVRALQVALPPREEQEIIVLRVKALFGLADAIERRIEAAFIRSSRLTQAILAKAFRGELVPTGSQLARAQSSIP